MHPWKEVAALLFSHPPSPDSDMASRVPTFLSRTLNVDRSHLLYLQDLQWTADINQGHQAELIYLHACFQSRASSW